MYVCLQLVHWSPNLQNGPNPYNKQCEPIPWEAWCKRLEEENEQVREIKRKWAISSEHPGIPYVHVINVTTTTTILLINKRLVSTRTRTSHCMAIITVQNKRTTRPYSAYDAGDGTSLTRKSMKTVMRSRLLRPNTRGISLVCCLQLVQYMIDIMCILLM